MRALHLLQLDLLLVPWTIVNLLIHQGQRVILPRLMDAVDGCTALLAGAQNGEDGELFVIDVSDAFHCCPVNPSEWKYQVSSTMESTMRSRCSSLDHAARPPCGAHTPHGWDAALSLCCRVPKLVFRSTLTTRYCQLQAPANNKSGYLQLLFSGWRRQGTHWPGRKHTLGNT